MKKVILILILIISLELESFGQKQCYDRLVKPSLIFSVGQKSPEMDVSGGVWTIIKERFHLGGFVGVKYYITKNTENASWEETTKARTEEAKTILIGTIMSRINLFNFPKSYDNNGAHNSIILLPYVAFGNKYYEAGTRALFLLKSQFAFGLMANNNTTRSFTFGGTVVLVL